MLNDQDLKRYSRHLLLGSIGEQGQQKLLHARVLVVGLGGLGSPAALYLAAAGIGRLIVADGDSVDLTNLQRQVLFDQNNLGDNKAEAALRRLQALNAAIAIEAIDERLDEDDLADLITEVDLVLDCSDNLATRKMINRLCHREKVALIAAAAIRWEGHLMLFDFPRQSSPCYECLYPPNAEEPVLNCSTSGVAGPLLGVLGSLQAMEAIKYLLGTAPTPSSRLVIFDGWQHEWRHFTIPPHPQCPVCH